MELTILEKVLIFLEEQNLFTRLTIVNMKKYTQQLNFQKPKKVSKKLY